MARMTKGEKNHRHRQRRVYGEICTEAERERKRIADFHPALMRGFDARTIAPGALEPRKADE